MSKFSTLFVTLSLLLCLSAQADGWNSSGPPKPKPRGQKKQKYALLVILDVSGSMWGQPLDQVKSVLRQSLQQYPKEAAAGLISFSGCDASTVRLEVPLQDGAAPQVITVASALQAGGSTNIHLALKMGSEEVKKIGKDYCARVLLLTDGMDTCGGTNVDATNYVNTLLEQNKDCNSFNLISLGYTTNLDKTFFDEIGAISERTNHDNAQTQDQLQEMVQREVELVKSANSGGQTSWRGDHGAFGNKPEEKPRGSTSTGQTRPEETEEEEIPQGQTNTDQSGKKEGSKP